MQGLILLIRPHLFGLLRCALDGVARHKGHAAGADTATVVGFVGVISNQFDLLQRQIQACGCNLAECCVCALAHFRPGMAQHRPFDLGPAVEFDGGVTFFREAKAEAYIFEGGGDADTARFATGRGVERAHAMARWQFTRVGQQALVGSSLIRPVASRQQAQLAPALCRRSRPRAFRCRWR